MNSVADRFEIRIVGVDQAELVWKIVNTSFEEYRNSEAPSSALMETVEHVKQALTNGREHALVCYYNDHPAGAARFYIENGLYFRRLGVLPEFRRKGISKEIISWLESYAREKGEKRIWCYTRASVPRNMTMYRSLGYELVDERKVERHNLMVSVATFSKSLD